MAKVSKSNLVDVVAKDLSLTKVQVEKIISSVFDSITGFLTSGDAVALPDFGIFKTSKRKARNGRNPKTGAPLKIAASTVVSFKVGKKLKDSVAKNK